MNIEQVKSGLRWVIATFGGILAGWFAAKGWFTVDQVTNILNSETTLSILVTIASLIWGMFTHTQTNAVAVVDTLAKQPDSGVKAVVTDATPTGRDLAQAMPGDTTVVAGTNAATAAAKS